MEADTLGGETVAIGTMPLCGEAGTIPVHNYICTPPLTTASNHHVHKVSFP